ncbi:hypothetical protein CDL12_20434 [Handroanthus impetiginosus]|uniref:Secreted protein n=1 Tax=Handroanthus impetiginosus TaxID=429701 RepID=A0A2G9GNX9_9LAMI|nr:hypothetical protein CDL12_20434 [Handroanthus impetiginosus]
MLPTMHFYFLVEICLLLLGSLTWDLREERTGCLEYPWNLLKLKPLMLSFSRSLWHIKLLNDKICGRKSTHFSMHAWLLVHMQDFVCFA